ncbi:MAG: hypothetical protein DLM50_05470 [Candidatus Meridianibacter frigidus]|nr:MAG: hypothetical protein DLM50_05470 [Candidatus Eremiobacteraeota bacterium]
MKIVFAYGSMCLIWGTTWLAIKVSLRTTPVFTGVGFRFVLAGLLLYAAALVMRRRISFTDLPWKLIGVLAFTFFGLNYVLTYMAETHLASGLVAVLFGTLPFFTFGLAHFMVGERTTPFTWLGAALAFGGVAVISLAGTATASAWYAVAAIGAAILSAFGSVYTKKHAHHDPLEFLPPSMLGAGIVLAFIGIIREHPTGAAFSHSALPAMLYLAIAGSGVAFFLNMWLLQRIEVWVVGLSTLIIPVLAVLVGILWGGEVFNVRDLVGAALVIIGVWLALSRQGRPEALRVEG